MEPVYTIRCADGENRTIKESDLWAALKMWGWLTPEEAAELTADRDNERAWADTYRKKLHDMGHN